MIWGKGLSLQEIFAVERGVTANKLYELLAAGRKIVYVGPHVEDQEALLARYGAHYFCADLGGSAPTKEDVQRLAQFLMASDDPLAIADRVKLVREELSARAQTERLAALFDEAAQVDSP